MVVHSFLLWYTINENCMIVGVFEISFHWFWFKEEGNVSECLYCDHIFMETLISRNTYCHYMSPKCYLCENMFLCQSVLELHMKRHEAPMYYFCTSCPKCGKLFLWIVMWWNILRRCTNLLDKLCTFVIWMVIDLHVYININQWTCYINND